MIESLYQESVLMCVQKVDRSVNIIVAISAQIHSCVSSLRIRQDVSPQCPDTHRGNGHIVLVTGC